jgi:hypothetical protein
LPDPTKTLVLHPFGFLDISQKVAPLGIAIQRFGATTPDKGSVFSIVDVKLAGNDASVTQTLEEFAPAQFFSMTDAEKLSRPSFDQYKSGVAIGGSALPETDWMRAREVTYEVIYLPEHQPVRIRYGMSAQLSQFSLATAAVAQSPLSHARNAPSVLVDAVTLQVDRYAVVSTDDLTLHAANLTFTTATAADQALRDLLTQHPELNGALQVMPAAAVASAAFA